MINFGTVRPGQTLYIPFASYTGSSGASSATTNFAASDIEIYKDGSTTQRASDNGYTLLDTDGQDFDGITGINGFSVNLADNSDAGFYAAGSRYFIVVSTVTIDSQTVSFVAATFNIGYPAAVLNTTIATLASQTSFTLTAGPAEDDALNGMWCVIHDVASAVQLGWAQILDYTGASKTVTLVAGTTYTAAATDNIAVMFPSPLQPTVLGRTADVSTTGEVGIDWANVGSPTTALDLSGTTIKTTQKVDVDTIKTNPVVNGGTITFPTNATVASTTNLTAGTIATVSGNVNGSVGSVTGDVGGNVTGSVGSVAAGGIANTSFAAGAIDAASIAANAITSSEFAQSAADKVWSTAARTLTEVFSIKKNTQLAAFPFLMVDSSDHITPKTGLTVVVQRSIDGAAFGNATNTPATELSAGWYYITLSAGDLNGDTIAIKCTSAGADARNFTIITQANA